ncbi:MAG: PilZ domain-containing protein, partial [Deltaproteobacteria bacterium]|nr:PilZ domain-containing protein [Deltaproteobacteria bacterium]
IFTIHDISLGGVRFLSQSQLKLNTSLTLKINLPKDEVSITLEGKVVWTSHYPGDSYNHLIGVQFYPYGERKNLNSPKCLHQLKALEEKYRRFHLKDH